MFPNIAIKKTPFLIKNDDSQILLLKFCVFTSLIEFMAFLFLLSLLKYDIICACKKITIQYYIPLYFLCLIKNIQGDIKVKKNYRDRVYKNYNSLLNS